MNINSILCSVPVETPGGKLRRKRSEGPSAIMPKIAITSINNWTVKNGFKIILSDKNVKAILINIFGGIVRCDRVANGVINAVKDLGLKVPVVVRLEGTNAEEAKDILSESGLDIIPTNDMKDAARKVVDAATNN